MEQLKLNDIKEYKEQCELMIYKLILELEKKTGLTANDLEFYIDEDEEISGVDIKLLI